MDGSENVYVAGHSFATWGSPVNPHAGNLDAFAAKLVPPAAPVPSISSGGLALLGGLVFAVAMGGLAVQQRRRSG